MNEKRTWAAALWHFYTQSIGIAAVAAVISFGVIRLFSSEGPVVEAVRPAVPVSTKIPYRGTLSYRIVTRRLESCEGNAIYTFTRSAPRVTVVITRPIIALEIRPVSESIIRLELPDSVYPGVWHFHAVVDSNCPAYTRQDTTADFQIEVLEAK